MTKQIPEAIAGYRRIFERRTEEQLSTLANIKRFMECLSGDSDFRQGLKDNPDDPSALMKEYGIPLDALELLPVWHTQYMKHRYTEEGKKWPLAHIWDEYMQEMITHRDILRDHGSMEKIHPRFHAWRERQLKRAVSELGGSAQSITHPILSFELSEGCSVGCWFCGISADKFAGHYSYTSENAALWQGILGDCDDLFGEATQTGYCYWATDPSDNPDYPKFIEDYYKTTGMLPQTTTAAPLKNVPLTREILALFDKYRCITNRFSVLTLRQMRAIHAEFTPEELMGVELVLQNKESLTVKASAGRAMDRKKKLESQGKDNKISLLEGDHSTIACVSGFLINMPNKVVRLASPTRAGKLWPKGYRVYAEAHFETVEDFRRVVEEMIDAHMPESVPSFETLAFRSDFEYTGLPEGFQLNNGINKHTVKGFSFTARLGELVSEGDKSAGTVMGELISSGEDIFLVNEMLQNLFDNSLFNDDPALAGIGSGKSGGGESGPSRAA